MIVGNVVMLDIVVVGLVESVLFSVTKLGGNAKRR
jgi:hypothetical protein